jgi:hypothetical protein
MSTHGLLGRLRRHARTPSATVKLEKAAVERECLTRLQRDIESRLRTIDTVIDVGKEHGHDDLEGRVSALETALDIVKGDKEHD